MVTFIVEVTSSVQFKRMTVKEHYTETPCRSPTGLRVLVDRLKTPPVRTWTRNSFTAASMDPGRLLCDLNGRIGGQQKPRTGLFDHFAVQRSWQRSFPGNPVTWLSVTLGLTGWKKAGPLHSLVVTGRLHPLEVDLLRLNAEPDALQHLHMIDSSTYTSRRVPVHFVPNRRPDESRYTSYRRNVRSHPAADRREVLCSARIMDTACGTRSVRSA